MEVGSPENGFDEISDLLKDDESTLPEDLDLSFVISKDIAGDYVYDDSSGNDKFNFHLSEEGQSELPSLSSNLGCYDIPGPCTENFHSSALNGCHNDCLLDPNVVDDQKLHFEPRRNQYYEDAHKLCGDYLGDSTFQMETESVDREVLKDVCTQPQGFVPMQDHGLEGEIIDRPNTQPYNEIAEKTFLEALEQELNQAEFEYNEEQHEVSVDQIYKLHTPYLHQVDPESKRENVSDSRNSPEANKEVESAHVEQHDQGRTSQFSVSPVTSGEISVSPETSLCAHHLTDDHRLSASNGHNDISYSNTFTDQIYSQAECYDQTGDTPSMDHSLHAGRQNSASSRGSGQRSQHMEGSSGKSVATPRNHHRKRPRSQTPRQRNSSSRCKRECSTNSQARSPYSWESHKRSSDKAACFHLSPRSQNISVSQGHKELSYSSRSRKHKHDLAGSSDRGREVTCKDHLLYFGCQKSSFRHESQERFLNSSSSKHATASHRNLHLHHNHRKVGKSVSPSPVRRRDLCSGFKRERNKSRSRSPCGRNRQFPRKRYSPRHRSPSRSYFSRNRSPEIRYLSPASYRRTGIGKPGTCLFVAGFGFFTTERELGRKFSRFGRVRNVRIIRDKRSGISRGYGFLSLERDEEADAAIRALHKTEWNGRVVLVEKSISN